MFSLICFIIFESFDILIMIFSEKYDNPMWDLFKAITYNLGGYLFFQAFAILVIKNTRDPL